MMKTNYHTHCNLCGHANGSIEDYVLTAIEKKMDVLGFADHGPIPIEPFKRMSYETFKNSYLKDIKMCKEKYAEKIKILASVEIEYYDEFYDYYKLLKEDLDYLVLGPHYYTNDVRLSRSYISPKIETESQLQQYISHIVKSIETGLFDYIAHPDFFMNSYKGGDELVKEAAVRIGEACLKVGAVLEYNVNGLRSAGGRYPTDLFYKEIAKLKVPVMIGADAHDPSWLEDEYVNIGKRNVELLGLNVVDSF